MNESKKSQKRAKVGKDSQASAVSEVMPAKKKNDPTKEPPKTDVASPDSVSLFPFLFYLFTCYILIPGNFCIVCFINQVKKCHYNIYTETC